MAENSINLINNNIYHIGYQGPTWIQRRLRLKSNEG